MMRDVIGGAFEVPVSAAGGKSKMEIHSNRQVIVEGCKAVVEYNSDSVTLKCGKGTVMFLGSDFEITSFFDETIVICGRILSVEFTM